MTSSLSTLPQL